MSLPALLSSHRLGLTLVSRGKGLYIAGASARLAQGGLQTGTPVAFWVFFGPQPCGLLLILLSGHVQSRCLALIESRCRTMIFGAELRRRGMVKDSALP